MPFFILLCLTLNARENPFFPSSSQENMPVSSNQIESFEPLKRASVTLPDSSRVLQEVVFTYQNLDGSVESKVLKLDQSIDWHLPIFISQSMQISQKEESFTPRPEIKKEKDLNKSTLLADFSFIKFVSVNRNSIKIETQDRLIRHFTMTNPHRIVIDFKRDADFLTMKKELSLDIFKSVVLGNHHGYYRVVITLDGQYKVDVESTEDGIMAKCI